VESRYEVRFGISQALVMLLQDYHHSSDPGDRLHSLVPVLAFRPIWCRAVQPSNEHSSCPSLSPDDTNTRTYIHTQQLPSADSREMSASRRLTFRPTTPPWTPIWAALGPLQVLSLTLTASARGFSPLSPQLLPQRCGLAKSPATGSWPGHCRERVTHHRLPRRLCDGASRLSRRDNPPGLDAPLERAERARTVLHVPPPARARYSTVWHLLLLAAGVGEAAQIARLLSHSSCCWRRIPTVGAAHSSSPSEDS